jgi:hypothetical protein
VGRGVPNYFRKAVARMLGLGFGLTVFVNSGLLDMRLHYWHNYFHDGISCEPSLCELATDPSEINIIQVIKSRRIKVGGACSTYIVEGMCIKGFLWCRDLRGKRALERPGVDWRIILKWIFK